MVKCKIKDCQEQANLPFEACDTTHGMMLKAARHSLQLMMSAKLRARANAMETLLLWTADHR
jgi:hypothetical protein